MAPLFPAPLTEKRNDRRLLSSDRQIALLCPRTGGDKAGGARKGEKRVEHVGDALMFPDLEPQ
jgi:hypothetical protein